MTWKLGATDNLLIRCFLITVSCALCLALQGRRQGSGLRKQKVFSFSLYPDPCFLYPKLGAVGFEPTTSWSQTMRAQPLRHAPERRIIEQGDELSSTALLDLSVYQGKF